MVQIERKIATELKPIPPVSELGFGQHFSDHWFLAKYSDARGWFESRIEPYGKLQLDPAASVLHYGQSLFEGMKAFTQSDGSVALFRPEFNYERMCEGAARLCLVAPPRDLFMQGVSELVALENRWVPKDNKASLYIRPTLIGSEAFLGVRPSREVLFFVILSPVGNYYASGNSPIRIYVEDKALRAAPGGLGATKAGANYAASLQAALRAKQNGFSQVLWLDVAHAGIEEVGTMNVFFVFKDEIVTPALNGSILAGGVRDSALQLLRQGGARVSERLITIGELITRHSRGELLEAFGTGTAAMISPIGELQYQEQNLKINNLKWGPVSTSLYDKLSSIQRGTSPDTFGWMHPVPPSRK